MPIAFDPAPTDLAAVVDPAWLGAMFAAQWPGARVIDVRVVETIVTQATKVRLALEVEGADDELPRNICIKGILSATGAPASASLVETRFYRDLASAVPVRVPDCIHAGFNPDESNGIIVMRDIIHAGGTFLTALTPFTPDETRASLEQLALLHAAAWQGSALYENTPVPRFLDQIGAQPLMPLAALQAMLDGPKGEPLPAAIRKAARLQTGLQALAAQVRARPACLVHGDAHAGNIYTLPEGAGLVDWQILQQGEWAQDVAYHIAAVLTPEDRRLHERALLAYYRDRLRAHGGPDLPAEEAWTRYRAGMVYGFFLWTITQKVEPAITLEFTRRLGLAVADLESFAVLGV